MTVHHRDILGRFYRALQTANVSELNALLDPKFVLKAAAGMPNGLGGVYTGRMAALQDFWGRVAQQFDVKALPVEFSMVEGRDVFVTGQYVGVSRVTGRSFTADFIHRIHIQGDSLTRLTQFTDTFQWNAAANPILVERADASS
jgi:ketosteroid isomerase-like protein